MIRTIILFLDLHLVNPYFVTMTNWKPDIESDPDRPIYLAIADALGEDIASGALARGERLPTHRSLAQELGVTVGTVSRAYAEAERRGLVVGEVGRGTFVRPPSAGDDWFAAGLDGESVPLLDLGRNFPVAMSEDENRFLADTLRELSGRSNLSDWLRYPNRSGTRRQRGAGARWIERTGLSASPDQVVVSTGAQHALTVIFSTLTRPGDLVLAENLTFPGMKAVAQMRKLRLRGLPMDDHGLIPEAFARACASETVRALYCVPTIHNPTTTILAEERRSEIAGIAERHGVLIVEDDIHGAFPTQPVLPITAHAPEISCYVTSTSKTLAPGLRIGYVLAPEALVERIETGIRATTWMAVPLMAEVTTEWILDGTADRLLDRRRQEMADRQQLAAGRLANQEFAAHREGTHVWLRLPDPWRSSDFVAQARERGVFLTGAEAFAVGREAPPHAVRLSLGPPRDRDELDRALATLVGILEGDSGPCMNLI